ncbi:hypothetical protein JXA05_03405 [Candidatus Peregrinibacteria bacterium]|nr:hypothetical protein [Candidatus Peregrinibacteria bacterium]
MQENQTEGQEAPDKPKGVFESSEKSDLKSRVSAIAEDSYQHGFLSRESYDFYRQATVKEYKDPQGDPDFFVKMEDFASKLNTKAKELIAHIEKAKRDKIASETDEKFLMGHLLPLIRHPDFVQDFPRTEKALTEKIGHMKKDREAYDKIAQHPLARNTGFLKTDEKTKLAVPPEKDFLKMTVSERRAWLKKAREALPKAIQYAEKTGEGESKELVGKYEKSLRGALDKKIIGRTTYNKFLDGFKKIDRAEKQSWLGEFGNQMKRYEKLWGDIRGTLKGEPLAHMESLRDAKGYTELFTEFGRVCEAESKKIEDQYENRLNKYAQEEKIIGKHTIREFMDGEGGIRKQDLKGKGKYLDQLDGQMVRYRQLWKEIGTLPKKAQHYLESKREEWGYTELSSRFRRFKSGEKVPEAVRDDPLGIVQNTTVRRAIQETDEKLKAKGPEKRRSFLEKLRVMFTGEQKDSFDAKSFQARLKKNRKETAEKETEEKGGGNSGMFELQAGLRQKREKETRHTEAVDQSVVNEEMKAMDKNEKTHAIKLEGFKQVERAEGDHTKRITQVEINREKGMDRFFFEDQRKNFKGKPQGGHDDLSMAVKAEDGRAVELNLTEIRAMERFLKQQEERETEEKRLDKAA